MGGHSRSGQDRFGASDAVPRRGVPVRTVANSVECRASGANSPKSIDKARSQRGEGLEYFKVKARATVSGRAAMMDHGVVNGNDRSRSPPQLVGVQYGTAEASGIAKHRASFHSISDFFGATCFGYWS